MKYKNQFYLNSKKNIYKYTINILINILISDKYKMAPLFSMLRDYRYIKRSLKRHIHKSKDTLAREKARKYTPSNSIKAKIAKKKTKTKTIKIQEPPTTPLEPSSTPPPTQNITPNNKFIIPNILKGGVNFIPGVSINPFFIIYLSVNNNQPIPNNILLTKSQSRAPPIGIRFNVNDPNADYLLILMDNDVPNGMSSPQRTSFLHLVVRYNPITKKTTFPVRYVSPTPPAGIHRYVFTLYDISSKTKILQNPPLHPPTTDRIKMASDYKNYLKGLKPIGKTISFRVDGSRGA